MTTAPSQGRSRQGSRHECPAPPEPALLPFTGEGARRACPREGVGADEGTRAQRRAALDFRFGPKSKSSTLRSRPHPALRATFSRKREKGCFPAYCPDWVSTRHLAAAHCVRNTAVAAATLKIGRAHV